MTNGNSFHSNGALHDYPPIENHGLIGDLQTAALVSTDGTIDWMCLPRFDSPSVFASLLDKDNGGYFRIRPTGEGIVTRQMYLPGTAILITRYMSRRSRRSRRLHANRRRCRNRAAPANSPRSRRARRDDLRDGVRASFRLRPREANN